VLLEMMLFAVSCTIEIYTSSGEKKLAIVQAIDFLDNLSLSFPTILLSCSVFEDNV